VERGGAFFVFVLWLLIFAAGILVDTRSHRQAISAEGVVALDSEAAGTTPETPSAAGAPTADTTRLLRAWLVVLLCFLPLNLAWLCAASSVLGALGNRANLSDDGAEKHSRDNTHPYTSALLRGFFVYLFMTSGLLLLDDTPFSNPTPGQYVRLAGFLSLFSFVVSYHPRLFSALIVSAFQRIQVRDKQQSEEPPRAETEVVFQKKEKETVEIGVVRSHDDGPGPA
jgi:hypothetical protein